MVVAAFFDLRQIAVLRIRVIGEVGLDPNAAGPLTRGARETLAYLVLNGPSSRRALASALWPDSDEPQALYNLRRALTDLRRNLGPQASRLDAADRGRVELDLAGAEVDLHGFRDALAAGDAARLAALGDGRPLDGVSGAWAAPARHALRAELTQGLVLAARHAAGAAETEALLRAALPHSRQKSSLWQSLVRLHAEAGDPRAARRVLAECEDAALVPAPVAVPDDPLGDLVGREDVLARLAADLRDFRLVTLCGPGGMGKTRAALALARRTRGAYPDGTAFVDLVGAADGPAVRDAVARAAGLPAEGWSGVVEWIAARRVLLVLDNAEHVADAVAEAASELLARTERPRLLVTSRVPLGLPAERRRRLPPLRPADAQALFAARACAADPEHVRSEESDRLCALLDGIPLAIELAAAQAGAVPLARLSADLATSLTLDSVGDGRPERHRTMRAALGLSLAALAPERRRALVALSPFVEGFTLGAAHAVAEVEPAELARWASASLLEFDGERYRMLEPVRQLAAEELRALGDDAAARDRHARWFADEARRAYDGPFLYDRDPRRYREERARWLPEDANVRAALAHLEREGRGESDEAQALWLLRCWFRLFDLSSSDARAWFGRLESRPEGPDSWRAAHWWFTVGLVSLWNDGGERAWAMLTRLAERAAGAGWLDVVAEIGVQLVHRPLRDPLDGEARTGIEVAVRLFERLGREEAARHARMQGAETRLRDEPGSPALREAAARLATEAMERGEVRTAAIALRSLARGEGRWDERRALLGRALRLQREAGHWGELHTLRAMAAAARELGTPEDEIEAWGEAIRRGEEIGWVGDLAEAYLERARAFLRGGQEARMWASMARALGMIRAQDRPAFLHLAFTHLADFLRLLGDDANGAELVTYLRRAAARGVFEPHPKFKELHPALVAPGDAPGSLLFASADDVVGWVEVRAALTDEAV